MRRVSLIGTVLEGDTVEGRSFRMPNTDDYFSKAFVSLMYKV